ncbi:MAG: hypothetical protein MUE60_15130, partial [Candidatus Eisenbacteria bacterium]|nr:hypothetical protein [Candidatus Eisenbacteria bacterium]
MERDLEEGVLLLPHANVPAVALQAAAVTVVKGDRGPAGDDASEATEPSLVLGYTRRSGASFPLARIWGAIGARH